MNGDAFRSRHVHLMGIGGAGVGALVPLLHEVGARVSGCDLVDSEQTRRLRAEGVPVALGHDPAHLDPDVDLVVHSSAVPEANRELRAAQARGIDILTRPACLAELMRGSRTVAVAGSHGKTTTAWMVGHLLIAAGRDPVVTVGGSVPDLGMRGSRIGGGGLFVAEVDESDGGFAHVEPDVAVVTNLDDEHLRHYGSFAGLCDAFRAWLAGVGSAGRVIVPADGLDPRVTAGVSAPLLRVGLQAGDVHASDLELGPEGSRVRVHFDGRDLGLMQVPLPGAHMVLDALMAVAAVHALGVEPDLAALAACNRVRRRFTVHGSPRGVRVVEDYAHHPTELRATLAAAALGGGRVHAVFQPHRWSRTADCFHEFCRVFTAAAVHALAVLPVYGAGEEPVPGVDGRDLAEAIAAARSAAGDAEAAGRVQYAPAAEPALGFVAAHARSGDTVLLLGAGDVGAAAPALVEMLEAAA